MRSHSSPFMLLLLTGFAVLANQLGASDVPRQAANPIASDLTGTVPFDLYRGYFMVVHGSVGSLKNLNFFLDTGTTPTILDSRVAKRLDLHVEKAIVVSGLGGRMQGEEVDVPSLELGPLERSDLEVVATDLSSIKKFVPVRIDAIVGLEVLGQRPFVIDYSAHVIRFGPAPPLPISVPLRLDHGMAVFEVDIDHAPAHLLLDTGAESIVLFTRGTAQKKEENNSQSEGIGTFENKQVWLHRLRLGSEEFRQRPALITRNPKPSQLDYDGLMSPAALGISRVSVDLEGGVLAFSR